MADQNSVPPQGDNTQNQPAGGGTPTPKYAGKFADEAALATGINNIRTRLGAEPLANVLGEGGTYKTPAEAEIEYKALERLAGSIKPAAKPDGKPTEPLKIATEAPAEADQDVPAILTKAGLNQADLETTWQEKGDLTPEQYDAIRKARPSLTKGDIKLIAQGMAATAIVRNQSVEASIAESQKVVGGKEQLDNLLASAKSFVTDAAELADFNRRLSDPKLAVGAVRDLAARHAAEVGAGRSQPLLRGGTPAGPAIPKSSAEFTKLVDRASRGDAAALAVINATPQSTIDGWRS